MSLVSWPLSPERLVDRTFYEGRVRRHLSPLSSGREADGTRLAGDPVLVMECTSRAVAAARLEDGRTLFMKVYTRGAEGDASAELQHRLHEEGFGAASSLRVPRVVTWLADCQVLVMEGAAGSGTLRDHIASGGPASTQGAWGAGAWLAALHRHPVRQGEPLTEAELVEDLEERFAAAIEAHPAAWEWLAPLLSAQWERLARCPVAPVAQIHGDYIPAHVFLDTDAVTVIDFDRSRPGNPAFDLGRFLHVMRADFRRAGRPPEEADAATAAFLQGYLDGGGGPVDGLCAQWSWSLLRRILKLARRVRNGDDPDRLARLTFLLEEYQAVPSRLPPEWGGARGEM